MGGGGEGVRGWAALSARLLERSVRENQNAALSSIIGNRGASCVAKLKTGVLSLHKASAVSVALEPGVLRLIIKPRARMVKTNT